MQHAGLPQRRHRRGGAPGRRPRPGVDPPRPPPPPHPRPTPARPTPPAAPPPTPGKGGPPRPPAQPPPTCGPLISQGRPTSSSAVEAPNLAAQYAVDGNMGTRWSSAWSDPQWMQVDLGSVRPLTRVKLDW